MTSSNITYHGRSFRSHVAARWAVFYDMLGITYFCDCQDYDLDDMYCRPDFYLPNFNCFIVTQEQFPSLDEDEMYTRLATCTNRIVYIPLGNVEIPTEDHTEEMAYFSACQYSPIEVKVYQAEQYGNVNLHLPQCIAWLFYRAYSVHKLSLRNRASGLVIAPFKEYGEEHLLLDEVYKSLKESVIALPPTMTKILHELEIYERSILHFLPEGSEYEVLAGRDYCARWYECSICKSLVLGDSPRLCQCSEHSGYRTLIARSPRLLAAYNAAKQAQF